MRSPKQSPRAALLVFSLLVIGFVRLGWAQEPSGSPTTNFSVQSFQSDLFTGAASGEIPIMVPPGTAGVTPKLVLRYNSGVVDDMNGEQAQWTGLGWTLDTGGYIIRDSKGTISTSDDTFKLIFGGESHELVPVGAGRYRASDETFWLINYNSAGDYWTLKTKDGTTHRFGFSANSRQTGITFALNQESTITFNYFVDQISTTSGTSVSYSYFKQSSSYNSIPYDQALYVDTITYSYSGGSAVGPTRQVSFLRGSRTDWTDRSGTDHTSYHQLYRLDALNVTVGGSLVRRYNFSYDYSIDRDPNSTWGGGATGDLTLKSLTMYGTDGVSALPALTFTYSGPVLASANNGIGGSISFTYEQLKLLYRELDFECEPSPEVSVDPTTFGCSPRPVVGSILTTALPGTIPLYRVLDFECEPQSDVSVDSTGFGCNPPPVVGYIYAGQLDRARYRVTSRTLTDGLGWSSTTNFTYWNPAIGIDVFGATEFRGHAQVRSTDPLGNYTDTYFYQDDVKKGREYQAEVRSSTGALYNKTVNTFTPTSPAPWVNFVALTQTDTYECEGQNTCHQHRKTFTYDANGNPTQTYDYGDLAVTGDERNAVTDWAVDATNWIHRPIHTALYDSANTLLRERWLYYDNAAWGVLGARGLLTKEESRLTGAQGNAGNPTLIHAYDVYGNKTSVTDPLGCTTTTSYDASQTYPATITNCLGHQTSMVYDGRFGVMTSRTDPYNAGDNPLPTTTWTYDVFGRVTKVTGPLDGGSTYGSVSTFYLDWGNPSLQRITTFKTEQHGTANYIWTEHYFDGLGRADHTRQEGPGGQVIVSEEDYDLRGQVSQRSAPHFSTETAVWTQFSYDVLGRQTQVTHPDGTYAQTVFDQDLVTTIDENGHTKRQYLDGHHRKIRVEEVNGAETYATTYEYDAADSLIRVTNQLGHQTTMGYDYLGRKVSMTDPNMGSWSYAYDKAGNLTSQTDAKNQTLSFTYDQLGRVQTKKQGATTLVSWTYDDPTVPFSKGRLTQVVDSATTTRFFYDVLGRVTQTQRQLLGVWYTMSQQYDALSRIASETFPDSEAVTYTYNEAGWLSSVSGYINGITYNARGQKTQLTYANNLTTTWTYNANNFRVTNKTTSNNQQNLTYGYDNVGNITSTTDTLFTGSRTFTYDNLDRLSTASGTFGANQSQQSCTYTYNAIGNLTNKCGAVLTYGDPLHPAAVTNHSGLNKSYSYDANGNMITRGNQTLTWDIDNRVSSISIAGSATVMEYDYTGMRVKKNAPTGITLYPFQGYEIDPNGVVTKFIRIGVENFASKRGTAKYFYHNDHLGSVNVITDINGTRVQLIEYGPWGGISRSEGTIDPTRGFTGQMLDPESGLYYYGGRYYDPEISRFISPDPFVPEVFDPQSLNRYSYVVNNPQNYIDPSGYFHRHKIKKRHGFFGSIFGRIFRILFDIALIIIGLPPVEGGGIGLIGGAADLFVTAASLATNHANTGISGLDTPGPFAPEALAAGGGGFLSPSLMLAMEAGCDGCSDRSILWDLLSSLFRMGEAHAGDRCRSIISCMSQGTGEGAGPGRIPFGGRPPTEGGGVGGLGTSRVTINDIVAGSQEISRSSRLIHLQRPGGFSEANRLFDSLAVDSKIAEHVTKQGLVRSTELSGGVKINVRPFSSEGRPTLEVIKPTGPRMKIRFE